MTLLEQYGKRINVSESVYSKSHPGETLGNSKKMAIAMLLNNTNKFLNESFTNSVGTQRADLGAWKKFCLNLTTVAVPNLISFDLVLVYPMSSLSGYITYIKYTAGSTKGQTAQKTVFNDPFKLGSVDVNYTGDAVVENITAVEAGVAQDVTPAWTPVVNAVFDNSGTKYAVKLMDTVTATGVVTTTYTDLTAGKFTVTPVAGHTYKFAYKYDNVVIPQNDIPVVNAELASMALIAKARRVAVYYSQIAAFQAKQDYGFDLGDQLAEKAVGQLNYEIDTEITDLLIENATVDADLAFNKAVPYGISKSEHYEAFSEVLEIAKQKVYDKTKRFVPNYMLIASDILPILGFIKNWKAAPAGTINGPYFAGTLNGIKVFVTPNITAGKFVIGVNGDDMMSSAAVYAPYMALVPTQLLGYADGGMSQGFSTMYALEMLNADLLISGSVTNVAQVLNMKTVA